MGREGEVGRGRDREVHGERGRGGEGGGAWGEVGRGEIGKCMERWGGEGEREKCMDRGRGVWREGEVGRER